MDLQSLQSRWTNSKRSGPIPQRLLMQGAEFVLIAWALLTLPTIIHSIVQCFDETYELLGRRARSPYSPTSWGSVLVAIILLLGWHICLGRLSYRAIFEGKEERRTGGGVSWGRILGRIVIPALLVLLAVQFVFNVGRRYVSPRPVVMNVV